MSRDHLKPRLGSAAAVCILVAWIGADAGAAPKEPAHCITPSDVDLNERYGVPETIIAAFCPEVHSGRPWTVNNGWFMNLTFDFAPAGFEPAGATPLADFIAKFVAVKYVVDPGTKQQRTYVFPNNDDLGIFHDPETDVANPVSLGALRPISVGEHRVDSYFVMRAMHCDGFGDVVDENCLGPGEVLFTSVPFTVLPGHN